MPKTKIESVEILGDSLTDRGTLKHSPMLILAGGFNKIMNGNSFTNGYPWSSAFIAGVANEFVIQQLMRNLKEEKHYENNSDLAKAHLSEAAAKELLDLVEGDFKPDPSIDVDDDETLFERLERIKSANVAADIADGVATHDRKIRQRLQSDFHLKEDTYVDFNGTRILRSRAIGGLTAHRYRTSFSKIGAIIRDKSISKSKTVSEIKRELTRSFENLFHKSFRVFSCFFARCLLSSLEDQRNLILKEDASTNRSLADKQKSLVIEWSGANDVMTVTTSPNQAAVDLAVSARLENAIKMADQGYDHFIFFNMPDLSLTPRYLAMSQPERDNASRWCNYFNEQLQAMQAQLQARYPGKSFQIFDAAAQYRDVFENPEKYGFDRDKRDKSFVESPEFVNRKGQPVPSTGYMSWDGVHPTADLHAVIAKVLYEFVKKTYEFVLSKQSLSLPKTTIFTRKGLHYSKDDINLSHDKAAPAVSKNDLALPASVNKWMHKHHVHDSRKLRKPCKERPEFSKAEMGLLNTTDTPKAGARHIVRRKP